MTGLDRPSNDFCTSESVVRVFGGLLNPMSDVFNKQVGVPASHVPCCVHGCVLSNLSIDSRRVISSIGMAVLAMLNLSVKREWSGHHRWSEKKPKEKHRGGPDLCQGYHLWTNSGNWPTNWPWKEGRENGPKT